jgi:type III restriction enzyme
MPDVVIENPIINSPFEEPRRHFYFDQTGITDKIVEARRNSAYFVPIPPSKKKSGGEQLVLGTEWTRDRQKENKFINDIRNAVAKWRFGGAYDGVTNTTRTLLEHWQRPERERKLFFCQIEALETAIYFGAFRQTGFVDSQGAERGKRFCQSAVKSRGVQDGDRVRQDGGDGDGDRLADTE